MRSKTVLILVGVVVLLAALAAVMLRSGEKDAQQTKLGEKMFADLPFQRIEAIRIVSRDGEVRLDKQPGGWGVVQKRGYPADFTKISDLVDKLRDLKIGRSFPADDDIVARLALHPPSNQAAPADQTARRLMLLAGEGAVLADLYIGKPRESQSGYGGQYLMHAGKPAVYLVDQGFRFLSAEPAEWLHRKVVDLKPESIASVACHLKPDAALLYELARPAVGEDFVLADMAEGEVMNRGKARRAAEALSPLQAEDVLPADEAGSDAGFDAPTRFVYRTFDGRRYTVELGASFESGDDTFTYARLRKEAPPEEAAEDGAGPKGRSDVYKDWVYLLSDFKTGDFIRERGELLQASE